MRMTSNRDLARQLGVSETAVRRAEKVGRIRREPDGAWDPARVKAAWTSNTDRIHEGEVACWHAAAVAWQFMLANSARRCYLAVWVMTASGS